MLTQRAIDLVNGAKSAADAGGSKLVWVGEGHWRNRVSDAIERVFLATRHFGTSSTDVPAHERMVGPWVPSRMEQSIFDGLKFKRDGGQQLGRAELPNTKRDAAKEPGGLAGEHDHWAKRYIIKGHTFKGYIGGHDWIWPDYEQVFQARVSDVEFKEGGVVLVLVASGAVDWSTILLTDMYGDGRVVRIEWKPGHKDEGPVPGTYLRDTRRLVSYDVKNELRRRREIFFDSLVGIFKPLWLGEAYGMRPQRTSAANEIYDWNSFGDENQGIIEVYEGGLGSLEGGPTYTEDAELYGVGGFKLSATPDKPITVSAKGTKFCGKNVLERSDDLTDAPAHWGHDNLLTVTAGQSDPLGGLKAFSLRDATASQASALTQTFVFDNQAAQADAGWIASVYLKAGTAAKTTLIMRFLGGTAEPFKIDIEWSTRTISSDPDGVGNITYDDGTWLRLEINAVTSTGVGGRTGIEWQLFVTTEVVAETGTVIAYGPQLECTRESGQVFAGFFKVAGVDPLRYIDQPAQLLEVLAYIAGYTPPALDLLTWAEYDQRFNFSAGIYLSNDRAWTFKQAADFLLAPFGFSWRTRDGLLAISWLQEPYDSTADPTLAFERGDFDTWSERRIDPAYLVQIGWRPIEKKLSDNQFLGAAKGANKALHSEKIRYAQREDRGVRDRHPDARVEQIASPFVSLSVAQTLALDWLKVVRHERRLVRLRLKWRLMEYDISTRASVGLDRYRYIDNGQVAFGDDQVILYDDGTEVSKEEPLAGLPGILVGQVDTPVRDTVQGEATFYV